MKLHLGPMTAWAQSAGCPDICYPADVFMSFSVVKYVSQHQFLFHSRQIGSNPVAGAMQPAKPAGRSQLRAWNSLCLDGIPL